MKLYFTILFLIFLSCEKNPKQDNNTVSTPKKENISTVSPKENDIEIEKKFFNSIYNCESKNFVSVLEEIPNRDTNAYKLTIASKNGKDRIIKVLDTRPTMSKIDYCNDLYTVVGFACGGPCFTRVFVFTDRNRPNEQFAYPQEVKNNPNFIAHIKDEEFEKLIIHNFSNSKELIVDISDAILLNYGQMDSLLIRKDNLVLYYESIKNKSIVKKVNLKKIL